MVHLYARIGPKLHGGQIHMNVKYWFQKQVWMQNFSRGGAEFEAFEKKLGLGELAREKLSGPPSEKTPRGPGPDLFL